MKLARFSYSERDRTGDEWQIDGLVFGKFNLVVGRNATGKTRLLKAIARVAAELSGEPTSGERTVRFEAVCEPAQSSTEWAINTEYFPFAGKMNLRVPAGPGSFRRLDLAAVYHAAQQEFGEKFQPELLGWIQEIGYPLTSIALTADGASFQVQEANRTSPTPFRRLSQGQQRAVTLCTFVTYLQLRGEKATILIDDFAEGLDFERATNGARYLLRIAAESDLQFIVATNDRFVMNTVPLEDWTILVEQGTTTKVVNYANAKERFENFKFTGLNNFDFFSMDFAQSDA